MQGGVSEFTAPCAFDPINNFLSYNYNYNSFFLMARDGVTNINFNEHLFFLSTPSKPILTPGRTPPSAGRSPRGGTLVET